MKLFTWLSVIASPSTQQYNLSNIDGGELVIASVYLHRPIISATGWKYVIWDTPFLLKVEDRHVEIFDAQSGMLEVNNLLKDNKNIRILSDKELNLL